MVSVTGGRLVVADTADLTPEQAAAIAEIVQTADGGLRVKMHSKLAALDALAKRVLPGTERVQVDATVTEVRQPEWSIW